MRLIAVCKHACVSALLMLAGCSQTAQGLFGAKIDPALTQAPFCSVAEPIIASKHDTKLTLDQVDEHNAVGIELCGWGK